MVLGGHEQLLRPLCICEDTWTPSLDSGQEGTELAWQSWVVRGWQGFFVKSPTANISGLTI